ncbi:hypothetical protein QBC34DRAFT_349211 [Podospora aff. communis PSN243]|uniref:Nephrocystin 3-like N-terminal domain-containing protein n=1 Tax=Podospora aff. communis PSN243 TaxID=3040156 RepID=A0AAV9GQ58_9PEZI|nr:hypothetical protein QBC34DRAFT_349211 [Podospora aff. communis PSN243]
MEPSRSFIPDLHVQSPVVDFIDNHADQYHPAFAVPPSKYDPAFRMYMVESRPPNWDPPLSWQMMASTRPAAWPTSSSRLPSPPEEPPPPPRPLAEPVNALKFWDTLFPLAMGQFKAEGLVEPEELVKKGLGIRDAHDWTSVFDKFELAKKAYSNVDKGFKAKFRNVYRSIADTGVQPLMNVTKLVPDVEYITPVLGIVEILLEAAMTAARVRNEILSGLDDVDMIFSQVELFLELYKADENIRKASINLIYAIFQAVESSMRFFLRASWKKAFSAAFKAEGYQQDTVETLTNVKSLSTILINEAENSHKYEMSTNMREILRRTREWQTTCEYLRRIPHDLRNGIKVLLDELHENDLLLSLVHNLGEAQSRAPSPVPPGAPAAIHEYISPQTLLDWIDIPDLASTDMEYITQRRSARLIPLQEQACAEQVVRTRQFKNWLASPSSTQLLIHGIYDRQRYISGLSLLCQTLAQSLAERTPHFLYLIFFCGLHIEGENSGGRAMIQSFICQLLCQYDFAGTLRSSEVVRQLVELGDIEELCELFEILVHRLPREVVLLCVIDGIVYYERDEFASDMGLVLVTLLNLSGGGDTQAVLKVLITSPTKTVDVRRPFGDELILSMESLPGSGLVASRERLVRELSE